MTKLSSPKLCGAVMARCLNERNHPGEHWHPSLTQRARDRGIEDIARELVDGWDGGFPTRLGDSEHEVIERLRDAIGPESEPLVVAGVARREPVGFVAGSGRRIGLRALAAKVRALPDASTASSGTPARLVGHISRAAVLALLESPDVR